MTALLMKLHQNIRGRCTHFTAAYQTMWASDVGKRRFTYLL